MNAADYHYVTTRRGEPGFEKLLEKLFACQESAEWQCDDANCHEGVLELLDCPWCAREIGSDDVGAIEHETRRNYVHGICRACCAKEAA
jgi:hypothetical protein